MRIPHCWTVGGLERSSAVSATRAAVFGPHGASVRSSSPSPVLISPSFRSVRRPGGLRPSLPCQWLRLRRQHKQITRTNGAGKTGPTFEGGVAQTLAYTEGPTPAESRPSLRFSGLCFHPVINPFYCFPGVALPNRAQGLGSGSLSRLRETLRLLRESIRRCMFRAPPKRSCKEAWSDQVKSLFSLI